MALFHDEAVIVLKSLFPNDELDWLPPFFAEGALLDTDSKGTYWINEQQFSVAVRQVLGAVKAAREWHYSSLWELRFVEATPPTTGVANVALVCRLVRDLKVAIPGERIYAESSLNIPKKAPFVSHSFQQLLMSTIAENCARLSTVRDCQQSVHFEDRCSLKMTTSEKSNTDKALVATEMWENVLPDENNVFVNKVCAPRRYCLH